MGSKSPCRRCLLPRTRLLGWRCLPSAPTFWRFRHEYGNWRCGRSGLENERSARRLGGDGLLATYETERRPVHERTIAEAVHNFGLTGNQLVRPALEEPGLVGEATRHEVADIIEATKVREFKTLGIVLGMRYENSPIVAQTAVNRLRMILCFMFRRHIQAVWRASLAVRRLFALRHFGDGFTLLVTEGDLEATERLCSAAAKRSVPLKTLAPADLRLRGRYCAKLALVRPDQHVAWRGDELPADCDALLARVTGSGPEGRVRSLNLRL